MRSPAPALSLVVPTIGRPALLARCIAAVRETVRAPHEIVVVASDRDTATQEILRRIPPCERSLLQVLNEQGRGGWVKAVNLGLRAARGPLLAWINDDIRPIPGAIDEAARLASDRARDGLGLVALYHEHPAERNVADRVERDGVAFKVFHARGNLYANFGLGPAEVFRQLGYFDERYFVTGADPDLSLRAQARGWRVVPLRSALLRQEHAHQAGADVRYAADRLQAERDNARLNERFGLPAWREDGAYPPGFGLGPDLRPREVVECWPAEERAA